MAVADFTDDRVFVVRPNDPCLNILWTDDQSGQEQWYDGPTYAVVGARVPDEKLERLSKKIGVSFDELRQFRDSAPSAE